MPNPPKRPPTPNASIPRPPVAETAGGGPSLAVLVDGTRLPPDEARAFWSRFSAYMEEHKGDLGGFAKAEGFASVRPEMSAAGAALVASRTAAQVAYTNVSGDSGDDGVRGSAKTGAMDAGRSAHGSRGGQGRPSPGPGRSQKPQRSPLKRG